MNLLQSQAGSSPGVNASSFYCDSSPTRGIESISPDDKVAIGTKVPSRAKVSCDLPCVCVCLSWNCPRHGVTSLSPSLLRYSSYLFQLSALQRPGVSPAARSRAAVATHPHARSFCSPLLCPFAGLNVSDNPERVSEARKIYLGSSGLGHQRVFFIYLRLHCDCRNVATPLLLWVSLFNKDDLQNFGYM